MMIGDTLNDGFNKKFWNEKMDYNFTVHTIPYRSAGDS